MTLQITLEIESEVAKDKARQRGFDSVEAYLLSLIEADWEEMDDEDEPDPRVGLREGLRELRQGLSYPYEQVWDMIENDDKD